MRLQALLGAVMLATAAGTLPSLTPALAGEGASSHYLPGMAGDVGFALPPKPGLQVANIVWIQSGDVGGAVLQGRVNATLDLTVVLDFVLPGPTPSTHLFWAEFTPSACSCRSAMPSSMRRSPGR